MLRKVVERRSAGGLSFRCSVQSSGTSLLFVHGLGGDHTLFYEAFSFPALGRATIYVLDLPGHGCSGRLSSYSPSVMCAALLEVMDNVHTSEFTVIAHSYGADIALRLASMASRVNRLVLVEPTLWHLGLALPKAVVRAENDGVFDEWFSSQQRGSLSAFSPSEKVRKRLRAPLSQVDPRAFLEGASQLAAPNWADETMTALAQSKSSSVCIFGDQSDGRFVRWDGFQTGRQNLVIADSGHYPMIEQPSSFYASLCRLVVG